MKTTIVFIVLLATVFNIASSQILVTFNADTTKIWDNDFSMECCANFEITSGIVNDTIVIIEADTSLPCRCICNYTNCISFIALPIGTYHVDIYRQIKYFGDPPSYAGSITFTISNPPVSSFGVISYQSGCHGSSDIVTENLLIPQKYATLSNYPNPFNPGTIIRYSVPQTCHVSLTMFNLSGQQVAILIDEVKYTGTYEFNFNAHNLSSGVYICRLNYGGQILSSKLTVLK